MQLMRCSMSTSRLSPSPRDRRTCRNTRIATSWTHGVEGMRNSERSHLHLLEGQLVWVQTSGLGPVK